MKTPILRIMLCGSLCALAGCAGSKPAPAAAAPAPVSQTSGEIPDWMEKLPTADGLIYGSAVSESEDMEMSKSSADSRACKDVAKQLGLKVQAIGEEASQRSGDKKNGVYLEVIRQAARYITDKDLTGCNSDKRKIVEKGDKFRVYALASLNSARAMQIATEALQAAKAQQTSAAAQAVFQEAMGDLDKALKGSAK